MKPEKLVYGGDPNAYEILIRLSPFFFYISVCIDARR